MDQTATPPAGQTVVNQQPASNGLGIAGFICSLPGLIGICFPPAGVLGLIGLILSAVGLRKEPRGLAIAGTIIGSISVLGSLLVVVVFGSLFAAGAAGMAAAAEQMRVTAAGGEIAVSLDSYYATNGAYPASLDELGEAARPETLPEDAELQYTPSGEGASYELRAPGFDDAFGTSDDFVWQGEAGATAYPEEDELEFQDGFEFEGEAGFGETPGEAPTDEPSDAGF